MTFYGRVLPPVNHFFLMVVHGYRIIDHRTGA